MSVATRTTMAVDNTGPASPTIAAGRNIRAEMGRRKLSQAALGQIVGLSQASLSLRLNGNVAFTIDELVKIAAGLDVSLETLTEGVAA
jgi:transcriptional regulator with XRE-family HTH domain